MRPLISLLALFCSTALAVPAQFTHQGRLLDSDGAPLTDSVDLTFRLMTEEVEGVAVWEETLSVELTNGFFAAVLGAEEETNPLDTDVLDQAPLWLELQVAGSAAMSPRMVVNSVPYASMAGVAEEVQGGPVDASQLAISGSLVVNEDGQWVGETPEVNWADIADIPADLADGIDDDTDSMAALGVSCIDGDIARWDGSLGEWFCDLDQDTWLSADEVRTHVGEASVDLAAGSTIGGAAFLTEADTLAPGWTDLTDVPDDFADGEDADSLATTSCADGQILVYALASGGWSCGEDTDATLTADEVKAMVEAMAGLALSAGTTIDGQPPRLEGDTIDWSDISGVPDAVSSDSDVLGSLECDSGQIVVRDEGEWTCADISTRFDADLDGVMVWSDCDDLDADVGSIENDRDCDGTVADDDCDDYDPSSTTLATDGDCDGYESDDDCDDTSDEAYPGASEICDGIDNDCDGDTDEGVIGTAELCPADSCAAIIATDTDALDGDYYVSFDGETRQVACDMSTDGGGWTRVYTNDFEDGDASGWTTTTTTTCGDWGTLLGGYDVVSTSEIERDIYTGGIAHSAVSIDLHYLFIDTWDGERGYVKINGVEVWSETHHYLSGGSDMCGRTDSIDDRRYIIETTSHSDEIVQLRAGSTLDQSPDDESYGIDNVNVWIR